jgi:predicted permease
VLNSVFGSEGVIYGSIFNIFFVVFVWTYGILLYKGQLENGYLKKEIISLLLNPSIIAVIIGLTLMTFGVEIKGPLLISIKSIGNITGPLSMFIIGVILSNVKTKNYLKEWTLYYGITIKLIIIPLIIYLLSLMLKDSSNAVYSVIIMTAMPASAMTSILAESYNKEKEFAAVIVSATTLISLLTVPLLIKIIM